MVKPAAAPTWGASASQVANGTSALHHGQKGSGVEALQRKLADAGYAVKPTGVYDDETRAAVRSFQDDYGQKGNGGLVDQKNWKALEGAGRRDERAKEIVGDGKIDAAEAKRAVRLAMADANLRPGDRSAKNVKPGLVGLYTRSGVPVKEAERIADRTLELADGKGGTIDVKKDAPGKMSKADKDALRVQTEKDTAANKDREKEWTTAEIKKNPPDFVRNVVQSDGDLKTENDRSSCYTQSMLAGAILKRPESAQELGDKLLSDKGKKEFPEFQKEPLRGAAERMKSGKYSPKDVSTVGTALHDTVQYRDPDRTDGKLTTGMSHGRELALHGRLQSIGWKAPEARVDAYGTKDRMGTHATAFANGTGYDPFNYPGSGGQATITRGEAAARAHGEKMGPRYGDHAQERVLLERSSFDDKGGLTLETGWVDGKAVNPPLRARYAYDDARREWVRDPAVTVAPEHEKVLPKTVPVDVAKLKEKKDIEH